MNTSALLRLDQMNHKKRFMGSVDKQRQFIAEKEKYVILTDGQKTKTCDSLQVNNGFIRKDVHHFPISKLKINSQLIPFPLITQGNVG